MNNQCVRSGLYCIICVGVFGGVAMREVRGDMSTTTPIQYDNTCLQQPLGSTGKEKLLCVASRVVPSDHVHRRK